MGVRVLFMSRNPFDTDNFLSSGQIATLTGFEDLRRSIEYPPNGYAILLDRYDDVVFELASLTSVEAAYQTEEAASIKTPPTTMFDLDHCLKIDARRSAV